MTVNQTMTGRDLITQALRKARVTAHDETPSADEIETGRGLLQMMLKAWQNKRYNIWSYSGMSVPATTSATYTLNPARPVRIMSVRWKRHGGSETPMTEMSREEYDALPMKISQGVPTAFHYDRQREAAKLIVWPQPVAVTTETLEISYEREAEDVALNDPVDLPGEFWEAAVYNLAARIGETMGISDAQAVDRIEMRARTELDLALSADREGSVYFAGGD